MSENIREELNQVLLDSYGSNKYLKKNFPYLYTRSEFSIMLLNLLPELKRCVGFEQNNPYHRHDVYEHSLYVCWGVNKDDFILKLAGLLHDIGKPDCCVYDEVRKCNRYHGHAKKSCEIIKDKVLPRLGLSDEEERKLLFLVEYHDHSVLDKDEMRRLYDTYGEEYLRDLFILKQADYDDHIFPEGFENCNWIEPVSELNKVLNQVINNV